MSSELTTCLYCDRIIRARGLCTLHWARWRTSRPMELRKDYHKPNVGWLMSGYRWRCLPNGTEKLEHRWIMEQHIGRILTTDEVVHHKNGVKTDNRLENLEIIDRAKHTKLHLKQQPIERICVVCSNNFTKSSRFNYKIVKTCSSKCRRIQQTRTRFANQT